MNDNQILVVHSRWVYNFMGIILEAQVSFIFSLLCILFNNKNQIFVIFKPYTLEETVIEKALHANECERWIEAFIANLGHPLWGSQSMQDLASLMRKGRTFLIPDANSCTKRTIPNVHAKNVTLIGEVETEEEPYCLWDSEMLFHTNNERNCSIPFGYFCVSCAKMVNKRLSADRQPHI